ncbi:hypothetical protein LSH36_669g04023 [Paralvinella palmiformis]|uniref:Uncharacterized protein n=1 Tax=Paralvinella palmiformis TaxID=53620 RepID=A0AAD9MWI4_9ANNE|nr:hypothetical protein LSH36_669g04023 [Paralvinella palmiformis]
MTRYDMATREILLKDHRMVPTEYQQQNQRCSRISSGQYMWASCLQLQHVTMLEHTWVTPTFLLIGRMNNHSQDVSSLQSYSRYDDSNNYSHSSKSIWAITTTWSSWSAVSHSSRTIGQEAAITQPPQPVRVASTVTLQSSQSIKTSLVLQ